MKKIVLLFSLLLFSLVALAQRDSVEEVPFVSDPKEMPRFPGGEAELYKFRDDRLFYPWAGDSIKGRVVTRFIIDKEGYVKDVEVLRGLNPLADNMAVSIIKQMPRWIPGSEYGKPISIYFTIPITFDPEKIDSDKKLNTTSSVMPSFKGGEAAMYKFIRENFKYPKSVCEMGLQGNVIIQFIIDSKGKVWHPYVYRSLHPDFDAEALRVVGMMPDWEPLKNSEGCHLFTLPINFRMK